MQSKDQKNLQRTTWFLLDVLHPIYTGVYEVNINDTTYFSFWDGTYFNTIDASVLGALTAKGKRSACLYDSLARNVKWRGLAESQTEVYSRDFDYYVAQNTGWSGGKSWFNTSQLHPYQKTMQEALDINQWHSQGFPNDDGILYRVTRVIKSETYHPQIIQEV